MKKFLSIFVTAVMLLSLTGGLRINVTKTAKATTTGTTWYVDASAPAGGNGSQSSPFQKITDAINAASNGDTIYVKNGTYVEQPSINKEITIIGESESGVIIDETSFSSGYGIAVNANNVTLKYFTLKGAPSYGIKTAGVSNLDYENLTVENCGRSGIDFNGCSNITLNNITSKNSTHGVGIALTDSHNANVNNITTSGNVWGNGQSMGMAIYTYGRYYTGGSSNITLSGTNSFSEIVPLYVETDNYQGGADYPATNINVSNDFHCIVRLPFSVSHQIYFYPDLNTALATSATLVSNGLVDAVVNKISDISSGNVITILPASDYKNYYVGPGMLIQSAVNAATNGDTIYVMAGTYPENVVVNKSVTLKGAPNHASIITAADKAVVSIDADNVTLDGFTIKDGVAGVYVYNASNDLIKDNIIEGYKGYYGNSNDPACPGPFIGEGVLLNNGNATIYRNTIQAGESDNYTEPQHSIDSIYMKNGSKATITQNILRYNHYGGTSCHASACGVSLKNNCTAIIMGNTIYDNDFGIHPEIKSPNEENPVVIARYNNIYSNGENNAHPFSTNCLDGSGFLYEKSYRYNDNIPNPATPFDATYNWWGESDKSGPYNALLNPGGHGNRINVSKNIDPADVNSINFNPWAGKAGDKTEGHAEGVTGGTAHAGLTETFENGTIGMGVDATANSNGNSDVMLVKYIDNPTSVSIPPSFPGSFYDMNVTNYENLNKVVLKLYYPASHHSLVPVWFDASTNKWEPCSDWVNVPGNVTVDTCNVDNSSYAGYVAVTVDNATTPSLSELTGTYFALGDITYTILATSGIGGTITPSGSVTVTYGSDQTFTITPKPGYIIVNITVDGNSVMNNVIHNIDGSASYVFHNVASNHTIKATFAPVNSNNNNKKPTPVFLVEAEVSVYGGYATVTPKKQTVKSGMPASVKIIPDAGYHIITLTDNGANVPLSKLTQNSDGSYTYTIPAVYNNHKLVVTLERNKYTITVKAGKGGTVSPTGIVTVKYNGTVKFTVTPDTGYRVKSVTVDDKPVELKEDNTFTLMNVKANHTVQVTFAKAIVNPPQRETVIALQIDSPFITVNGIKKKIDKQGSKPIIKNNRTLLPIRVLIESLGGSIQWNAKTREVTINLNGNTIILTIGKNIAMVNGIKTQIDPNNPNVVPIIINGRTYLPLRFIAEHLGASVDWDAATRTVTIYYWP